MAAGKFDLINDNEIEQGATWQKVLTWKDSDGNPINNTGYTARMKIKKSAKDATEILSLANGSGITLGGVNGQITITLTDSQTAAIPAGSYVYDLELVSGGGQVTRLLKGAAYVSAQITS